MTQGSEWQGGGGVEARLGPETMPFLKMVLHPFPAIVGLVQPLPPALQWGRMSPLHFTLPPQDRQAMALRKRESFIFS